MADKRHHYIPKPTGDCHRRPEKKCNVVECASQDQVDFCVPISFDQELTSSTGGILEPLSLIARNVDKIKGVLKLKFSRDLSRAAFALYVFNATSTQNQVAAAHLHLGGANTNGPIIVSLYSGPTTNINGLLAKGFISNANIVNTTILGLPVINSLASIYEAIRQGAVYTNVHTTQFPNGLIRGQIFFKTSCA